MRLARLALTVTVAGGLLIAAPAAALANWLQQTTANLGSDLAELTAVSCTSPNICMAVGNDSSTEQLLSETRSPSGWTVRSIPQPTAGSILAAVSCTKSDHCIAVGRAPAGQNDAPLAEIWNGTTWDLQPTLVPPGATSSQLFAVSCPAAKTCVAVGQEVKGGHDAPFSEVWNGTHWQVKTAPEPSVQPDSELAGISCPSTKKCLAVGESFHSGNDKTLAEVWNGTKWTISKTPNAAKGGGLSGVSCTSVSKCMAVGANLAESWNGKTWLLLKIGKPQGTAARLSSVSCTRAGPCYAVGDNFSDGVEFAVAEIWNGSKWSVQQVPVTASFDSDRLDAVSCTTATNCTAVGSYDDSGPRVLAEDFNIRWQNVSPTPFNGVVATGLNAVSCASPQDCVAVGTFETSGSEFDSFSVTWDGAEWNSVLMPKSKITNMAGVSCVTRTDCIAVGNLSTGGGHQAPLAELWNGTGWAIKKTPAPAGLSRDFLLSVSCPASNSCMAVGVASKNAAKERTLAERWNGKKWQITPTPNPAGNIIQLNSVSCSTASSCVGVGTSESGTFAQVWNGKTWKPTSAVPNPKGATHSVLQGVSCPASNDCIATGSTFRHSKSVPLAELWNGKKWSPQQTVTPSGATGSVLSAVSCTSGNACVAVGTEVGRPDQAIAQTWTGRRWVAHAIEVPSGSTDTALRSVSCNTAIACMAAGSFDDSSPMEQMLAEQYS